MKIVKFHRNNKKRNKNKIIKRCFRCGTKLWKSPVKGYTYFCPTCYEDFYSFEQE